MAREKAIAGFGKTWLSLGADLGDLDLDPFHKGLTSQKRMLYTAGVLAFALAFLIVLDALGAAFILLAGLWVIWNQGNTVTKVEKKAFLSVSATAIFLGAVEKFSILLHAAGLLAIALVVFLILLWRR